MLRFVSKSLSLFILMIGDEGVFFVPHRVPGETESFFVAEGDERGAGAIFSALRQHPRVPVLLFADILAQDFRREVLPRLNFLDRPKLIERRLRQAFPQAGLVAHLNIKDSRTDVLLAALYEGGPVFEWIEKLKAHHVSPRIALLPIECADIAGALVPQAAQGWTLMLSRQRTGGFRQIVTHNGELIFTRLTPPLPSSAGSRDISDAITRDIKATLGYLGRMGLTDSRELQTILLMPNYLHAALKISGLPIGPLHLLTPHHAAIDLELPMSLEPDEPYADRLFAGWLMKRGKSRLSFMPADIKKTRRTAVIREWGWRAASVALLIAFGMTAWQGGDLVGTLIATQRESAQLAVLKERLATERAKAAPVTEPLGRLREAIERRRLFSEPVTMPWRLCRSLSQGLAAMPGL